MKKLILVTLMLAIGGMLYSQSRRVVVSEQKQNMTAPYLKGINDNGPVQGFNPTVNTRIPGADIIGTTWYDSQSNGSMARRAYQTVDGKMGAVWTRGMQYTTSYPDRGTGYNYFNGTAWLAEPSGRIESIRTGWPSIDRWNGDGEIVVSHQSAGGLVLNKRTQAGTGTWTESILNTPSGAPFPLWPSIMTSGNNHQYIHILAVTTPVISGGALYNGLDGALLYWRSSDGGVSWEVNGVQIAPLDSSQYTGFGADSYSWANSIGDTIAFVVGDNWTDTFIMQSFDNGDTWTKIPILNNAYKKTQPNTYIAPFYASDGSNSLAIDSSGIYHVVFGRMRASDDGTGRVYYPYTDGLVYWNSTMPVLNDSLDLDTLDAHGQLLGYVLSNANGDTIQTIPYYGVSMTSFGNITVDESNHVFALWSGVTVDNPTPEGLNYRHLYTRGSVNSGQTWSNITDLNTDINDIFMEFVFPYMAKVTTPDALHVIAQSSDVPGSSVQQPQDVPQHENDIIHTDVMKNILVGIDEARPPEPSKPFAISLYPNPFRESSTIRVELPSDANLTIEITSVTGQVIYTENKGLIKAGSYKFRYNGNDLSAGVYFCTVKADSQSQTRRFVVR